MRIWDVDPGYLNRQSLLGEHRELHAIVSIMVNRKSGYANHPETKRWQGFGWALGQRHRLLVAEMALRGYNHHSPVLLRANRSQWPETCIDEPRQQLILLADKYRGRQAGRIPLPQNSQQLWSQHKYSILARNQSLYRELGRQVAGCRAHDDFTALTRRLVTLMRQPPPLPGLRNALLHMWGHVSGHNNPGEQINSWSPDRFLREIRRRVMAQGEPYLLHSTALGELGAWLYWKAFKPRDEENFHVASIGGID